MCLARFLRQMNGRRTVRIWQLPMIEVRVMNPKSDFLWLVEHDSELLEKYPGKWIAVQDGRVTGIGDTATAAAAQAELELPGGDYLLQAYDRSADVV